ncbi:hypothetical protein [Streptomyces sp. NBC_00105]|uniref:hypothetical protein n=1 Tax=Streptomyces sp. NBC_00105 TaxID=2903622 RepID=UPI003249996E
MPGAGVVAEDRGDDPRLGLRLLDEGVLGIGLRLADTIRGTPELTPYLEQLGRRLLRAAHALTLDDEIGAEDR